MTVDDQVRGLDRDGFVQVPGVLAAGEVARLRAVAAELAAGAPAHARLTSGGVHLLGAAFAHPALTDLAVDERLLPTVSGILTPNIHLYHSHLDVHPPEEESSAWRWHRDGGRMGGDLEVSARLSVKVGFWLTDVDGDGYGNLEVVPGSHRRAEAPTPGIPVSDAVPLLARAGDAVIMDRRLWHRRGTNLSTRTRMVAYFAYAPRWVTQRERAPSGTLAFERSPLRRQILGSSDLDPCQVALESLPVLQWLREAPNMLALPVA